MTSHLRLPLALAAAGLALGAATAPTPSFAASAGPAVVERFDRDPLAGQSTLPWFVEGDATRFTYRADAPPAFPGDRPGTLRVLYDTTLPTGRLATPLGSVLTANDDFTFGAILTVRSSGFFADPQGFSQIAFGLWNGTTTGMARTSFPSDSFDLLEIDWFANITDFGGPFLSPSVFGGNAGGNAFFNFAFASRQVALPLDTPILVEARYTAATATVAVRLYRSAGGTLFTELPDSAVDVGAGGLAPGFLLDVLGIAAYGEGWPSLHAVVDYDLVYGGALPLPFRTERGGGGPSPAPAD
jgi:hypothetical protein